MASHDTEQKGFAHNAAIMFICVWWETKGKVTIRNIIQHETHYMKSALQIVKQMLRFNLFHHGPRITNSSSQQILKAKINYHL